EKKTTPQYQNPKKWFGYWGVVFFDKFRFF
ncbi:MAG: hypothetical protein RL757_2239, partial [Bacteroidota bacterium]